MIRNICKFPLSGLLVVIFITGNPAFAAGEVPPVLNSQNHPGSPEHNEIYSGEPLSLDATLSWKNRFNGNETFNEQQTLSDSVMMSSTMMNESAGHTKSMPGMAMDGTGVIKAIRADQGKIKISHGPIDKLGMPEMTMMFKVVDPAVLDNLEQGQKVDFNVDNSSGGFIVTHIMPTMESAGDMMSVSSDSDAVDMDAVGTIKTIRESQGKIKIEHGPIDKYGMPGMIMMFKVTDPAMLEGLQTDDEVQFNVDNSSGGFEITNIKRFVQ